MYICIETGLAPSNKFRRDDVPSKSSTLIEKSVQRLLEFVQFYRHRRTKQDLSDLISTAVQQDIVDLNITVTLLN